MVSQDTLTMCRGCQLNFAADLNRDISGLLGGSGTGSPLILFPDPQALTCLLRVRLVGEASASSYAMEIVGMNVRCQQGILDVFLWNGSATSRHTGLWFTECKWGPVKIQMDGTTLCRYICIPLTKSDTAFIRVSKAKHISDSYEKWSLQSVKLIRI